MPEAFRLQVLTPAEALLDEEEVGWMRVVLADGGSMGIRPGHAPLLAETAAGALQYGSREDEQGREHATLDLEAGILRVDRDRVTVFTGGLAQTFGTEYRLDTTDAERFDRLARALLSTLDGGNGDYQFWEE
jgi:F0F1-type ATP synthase epsilon subunit